MRSLPRQVRSYRRRSDGGSCVASGTNGPPERHHAFSGTANGSVHAAPLHPPPDRAAENADGKGQEASPPRGGNNGRHVGQGANLDLASSGGSVLHQFNDDAARIAQISGSEALHRTRVNERDFTLR